jgi:hypothetical protein
MEEALIDSDTLAGQCFAMSIAQSKVAAQGQISVPAKVRKRPGAGEAEP